jgi:hypothetical protein
MSSEHLPNGHLDKSPPLPSWSPSPIFGVIGIRFLSIPLKLGVGYRPTFMPHNPFDWSDEHYAALAEAYMREKRGLEESLAEKKEIKSELRKQPKQKNNTVIKRPLKRGPL